MTRSRDIADQQKNAGGAVAPFVAGKNKIINGDFGVWQRGTTISPTIFAYTADRWQSIVNGGPTVTITRESFAPGNVIAGYESPYFFRANISAVSGSSVIAMQQQIEDVRTFAGQTITFSFWAKSDASRTWGVRFDQNFGTGGSSAVSSTTPTINVTTSWQRFSITLTLASIAGKTIGTGSSLCALIFGTSNTVQVMDIWGVQVEAGSVATSFTTASGSIGGELALCQRYYERISAPSNGQNDPVGWGIASTTTTAIIFWPLKVTKRVLSSTIDWSGLRLVNWNTSGTINVTTASAVTASLAGTNIIPLAVTATGMSTGLPVWMDTNGTTGYLGVSAEL